MLALIQDIIRGVKANEVAKSIEVDVKDVIDRRWIPKWPIVEVCESEIRQILYNLVGNAFEASSQDTRVCVRVTAVSPCRIAIEVQDFGCGIAKAVLPNIFEPFFTTKADERHPGTGLGLAISRSLAVAMGGTLEVESQHGVTTTFRLTIPVHTFPTSSFLGNEEQVPT
ncbi:MAG: sensor histidine kinase [Pirellula sp.]